jgi:hypothetical protein
MYLTNEQLQELWDTGIDEKIEKFAELFQNGTEVTREICVKHPDVFSFGLPGARLMPPNVRWKPYWDRVLSAKKDYKMRMLAPRRMLERNTRSQEEEKLAYERYTAYWNPENPDYDAQWRLFTLIHGRPPLPLPPKIPREQALAEYNFAVERITWDYEWKLALIFYETSII